MSPATRTSNAEDGCPTDAILGPNSEACTVAAISIASSARKRNRLEYLDGLRGILCLLVVVHHFCCGFFPCFVFGATAQWLLDPNICNANGDSEDCQPYAPPVVFTPLANGTFCVAVFFVMSGLVLAHHPATSSSSLDHEQILTKWQLTVIKRYFRLGLPVAAALLYSYGLSPYSYHEQASELTSSAWLKHYSSIRPSPAGLVQQMLVGVWHGTSTLNNALWTMPIELFGSYLIFLLNLLLKDLKVAKKRQFLFGLILLLLLPSSTQKAGLSIRMDYYDKAVNAHSIMLSPAKHAHILSSSNLPIGLTMNELPSEAWDAPKEHPKPQSLDKDVNNLQLYHQLQHSIPSKQELRLERTWALLDSPFLWYAAFVAGMYLSTLQPSCGKEHKKTHSNPIYFVSVAMATLACASLPMENVLIQQRPLWRGMKTLFGWWGFTTKGFKHVYYILGAFLLVHAISQSDSAKTALSNPPWLQYLGRISFSLYLTHLPLLYSLTAWLFCQIYEWVESYALAAWLAFVLSLPVMLLVATLFAYRIDRPAIRTSGLIAKWFLLGSADNSSCMKKAILGNAQH